MTRCHIAKVIKPVECPPYRSYVVLMQRLGDGPGIAPLQRFATVVHVPHTESAEDALVPSSQRRFEDVGHAALSTRSTCDFDRPNRSAICRYDKSCARNARTRSRTFASGTPVSPSRSSCTRQRRTIVAVSR
jgi:hypothetical protein